jgi:hypothetical protein
MNEDLKALDIITQIQAEKVSIPVSTPRGKRTAKADA